MSADVCTENIAPATHVVLRDLIHYAVEAVALEADAPWKLSSREAARMRRATGYSPPGGWEGIVGLAAGTDLLDAQSGCFAPNVDDYVGTAEEAQDQLLSALRVRLCPPAAAASLLVALGIHPLYGLAVARRAGASSHSLPSGLLADEGVQAAQEAIFGTISTVEVGLSLLAPGKAELDDLVALLRTARSRFRPDRVVTAATHLPPWFDDELSPLVARMTAADLLDHVFVPAGVARRHDDGTLLLLRPWV